MPTRTLEDLILEINRRGWRVLNLFQLRVNARTEGWRCNLQRWSKNGSSESYFTEFADAETIQDAALAALKNAVARDATLDTKAKGRQTATLSAGQVKRLEAACVEMMAAWGQRQRSSGR